MIRPECGAYQRFKDQACWPFLCKEELIIVFSWNRTSLFKLKAIHQLSVCSAYVEKSYFFVFLLSCNFFLKWSWTKGILKYFSTLSKQCEIIPDRKQNKTANENSFFLSYLMYFCVCLLMFNITAYISNFPGEIQKMVLASTFLHSSVNGSL